MGKIGIGERLNANSKKNIIFAKDYRKVRLDPRTLIPSEHNKYSQDNIEELADNMLLVGQLQEIIVGRVDGQDRIIVGHRRTAAAILNIERGHDEFKLVDCKIKEMSESLFMLTLHSANIFNRQLSDWELTNGVAEFTKYLVKARDSGELTIEGKMRDYIANVTGKSTGKINQINSINNNLCEEGKEAFKEGKINFSTAYETSRLPESKQHEVIENGELLSGEVKQMVEQERKKKEPTEEEIKKFYEICAKKYDGDRSKLKELLVEKLGRCHAGGIRGEINWECSLRGVKLGSTEEITWSRFVQLINELYPVAEDDYKTEEQRYDEEQEAIDRDTKAKIRQQSDDKKMEILQSEEVEKQKTHIIRMEAMSFDDVASGKKSFELRKNDRGYKEGDVLDIMEFKDGRNTGREIKADIVYMLEYHRGLEEGWCILGIKVRVSGKGVRV